MIERQQYYKELIAYLVEKYYETKIDLTKDTEVPLPNARIDMVFEIPKENLEKATGSPFPYFAEVNVVHIKALNDKLTREDVIQYLGELYIIGASAKYQNKSIVLAIISAEKTAKSIWEGLYSRIESTEKSCIYKIGAELPAYLFVLEGLPESEQYKCFLPFQPMLVIKEVKEYFQELTQKKIYTPEEALILLWLKRLQPNFYKEIEMVIDTEEIIKELCPKTLQSTSNKVTRKNILNVLQVRFGSVSEEIKEKLEIITTMDTLDVLMKLSATAKSLDEFRLVL